MTLEDLSPTKRDFKGRGKGFNQAYQSSAKSRSLSTRQVLPNQGSKEEPEAQNQDPFADEDDVISCCKMFRTDELQGEKWSFFSKESQNHPFATSVKSEEGESSRKSNGSPTQPGPLPVRGDELDQAAVSSSGFPKSIKSPPAPAGGIICPKTGGDGSLEADLRRVAEEFVSQKLCYSVVPSTRIGKKFKNRFRGTNESENN